ncbi:hypothetical protein R1sor_022931 [Riccia sorocarpa]|uniref:Uncharacterized protein n=1 Tax=Riccia sorocarpa TaxID=122646 RepID=A0ABD3GPL5_9MARC
MLVAIRASVMRQTDTVRVWSKLVEAVIASIQLMHEETGLINLRRPKCVWRYTRDRTFVDRSLLSSFSEREFIKCMRVKPSTFDYLCSMLAPELQKRSAAGGMPLQNRIAVALNRLGTEDMHREAIEFLEQEKIVEFRRLKYEATVKLLDYGRVEVDRSTISAEEMVAKMYDDNADEVFQPDTRLVGTIDLQFLRDGDIMREQISKSLYLEHLERDTNIAFDEGIHVEDDTESEYDSLE